MLSGSNYFGHSLPKMLKIFLPNSVPEEIEMACPVCKKRQTKIVRLTGQGRVTSSEATICQNKNCLMFIDIEKIPTWILREAKNYRRDFRRENKINFRPQMSKREKTRQILAANF